MRIAHLHLSPAALRAVVEEFVTRDSGSQTDQIELEWHITTHRLCKTVLLEPWRDRQCGSRVNGKAAADRVHAEMQVYRLALATFAHSPRAALRCFNNAPSRSLQGSSWVIGTQPATTTTRRRAAP